MGSTSLTAASVMDKAASLMNDTLKTVYTYAAQMPYLNMALNELEEHFQLNNIPVTDKLSASITVPAGTTSINAFDGIGAGPVPRYPQDLVEVQSVKTRTVGSADQYSLINWWWEEQKIKFDSSDLAREFQIDYIATIFPEITNQAAVIGVINARTFLFYRTAALCTQFIGENASRATELNNFAVLALDRVTGIGTKAKQYINTRRRPFMMGYKRRGLE